MRADPNLNFIGNVEGNDLPFGIADVVVTEGFAGNVALKVAEGLTEVATSLGRSALHGGLLSRAGMLLLSRGMRQLRHVTNYREYGGAPFLGFRQIIIKAHGRSSAHAIANAIKVAAKGARDGVAGEIRAAIDAFEQRAGTAHE